MYFISVVAVNLLRRRFILSYGLFNLEEYNDEHCCLMFVQAKVSNDLGSFFSAAPVALGSSSNLGTSRSIAS
jgi:hypothetical protein